MTLKRHIFFCLFSAIVLTGQSQELYNLAMPASTIPKNTLVVRGFSEWYNEAAATRAMGATGLAYGITGNLMIQMMLVGSNHHDRYLPEDLVSHTHVGGQTITTSFNQARGDAYLFRISGVHTYLQWRFFAKDSHKKHFRMAAFAEYSTAQSAHDEAEGNLWDDNSGYGGGLIFTYLKNRFAASLTGGAVVPESYHERNPEGVRTTLEYGNTYTYSLSLGYLLYPRKYLSYAQKNTNLYLEFFGKQVEGLNSLNQDGDEIAIENSAHQSAFYLEAYPGVQQILNSTTRLEFSVGIPIINRSYSHFTPLFNVGFRHYIML